MWWHGRQWAVTEYGIERLDGTYVIEAKWLTENIETYGWPGHMRGKDWVDPGGIRDGVARGAGIARRKGEQGSHQKGFGTRVISRTDPCKFRATSGQPVREVYSNEISDRAPAPAGSQRQVSWDQYRMPD